MIIRIKNEQEQSLRFLLKILYFAAILLLAKGANTASEPGSYEIPGPFPKNENKKERLYYMAKLANHYYRESYHDEKNSKPSDNAKIGHRVVLRANHGLAHGVRQAALALDFIDMVKDFGSVDNKFFLTLKAAHNDEWFPDKMAFLMMMSRTGRGSEVGFSQDAQANYDYTAVSIDIFSKEALKLELYKKWQIRGYANALNWLPPKGTKLFTLALNTIFRTAHILDLRRISNMEQYNAAKLKREVLELWSQWGIIFDPAKKSSDEVFDMLWAKAGFYLNATGDRNPQEGVRWYQPVFVDQSRDPRLMIDAIFF